MDEVKRRIAKGMPLVDERTKLGDYLDQWLAQSVKPHRAVLRSWTFNGS